MFDFGAGTDPATNEPLRWLVVAAGTGIWASSNRGVTFVVIATDRGAARQYFTRSKSWLIATSETQNKVLYWAGSVGTYMAALAVGSAPPAKHVLDYNGFTLLMNDSGGNAGSLTRRPLTYLLTHLTIHSTSHQVKTMRSQVGRSSESPHTFSPVLQSIVFQRLVGILTSPRQPLRPGSGQFPAR